MASFKESVIIPYSMFKSCDFKDKYQYEPNSILSRQRELMQERMFGRKNYPVYTSYVPSSPKANLYSHTEGSDSVPEFLQPSKIGESEEAGLTIDKILSKISVSQRPNVQSILQKLLENYVKWDSNGKLVLGKKVIEGSNIISLLQYLTKTREFKEEPAGIDTFWDYLMSINIPKSWFKLKPLSARKEIKFTTPAVKYPLEETERSLVSSALEDVMKAEAKDMDSYDVDESKKLDIAASHSPEHENAGVSIGEIEKKELPIFSTDGSEVEKLNTDIFSESKPRKKVKPKRKQKQKKHRTSLHNSDLSDSSGSSISSKSPMEPQRSRSGRIIKKKTKWDYWTP